MHGVAFLQDLAVVMIVAGVVTLVFHRLKQPVVLGYILAGVIIGPHTPPFPLIHDEETVKTLAELGVVFLMFSLGLEFSLRKLKKVGSTALIGAALEIVLMVWVGYEVGRFFGWSHMDSLFLGAMLSISSTTIIVKALGELGKTRERFAQLIFGILIVEDMLAIVMIALLSGIAMTGTLEAAAVGKTTLRLGIFLVVALIAGLLTVPRLLSYIARFKSNEMLLVAVLALCFGVSLLAVKLGYSVALGAFVIGAVIAESREIARIEHLMEPVRDMFSAVFFVAIGLMIQPALLLKFALPIAVITIAVVVGKVLTCSLGAFVAGNDQRTSLRVGMGLAQIGEFSFIIASLGLTLRVTSDFLYPIAVTVSAITTLLTPYLIKSSDALVTRFDRRAPQWMKNTLEVYTRWVGELGSGRSNPTAGRFIRKWLVQIGLNLLLTAAAFIAAMFVREQHHWMQKVPVPPTCLDAVLWGAALIAAMPMLIASYRKLQAVAMLVGEAATQRIEKVSARSTVRTLLTATVSIIGTGLIGAFVLVLSATLLPSWKILVPLGLVVIGLTALLSRRFIQLHSKAQLAIRAALEEQPVDPKRAEALRLSPLLAGAQLAQVTLTPESRVTGYALRDIGLRTATGASVVAIERAGEAIINPGAEVKLAAGDTLMLFGCSEDLESARKLLAQT